jgi:transposase
MSSKRFSEEFKIEAVKQVTQNRYPVAEVAGRLGTSQHGMHGLVKRYSLAQVKMQ